MLIMGAFGHSPLRTLMFGSKTADLLRSRPSPRSLLAIAKESPQWTWNSSALDC